MPLNSIPPMVVTLPDGARISYVRAGQGPVLIMLHGVMGDYRSWAPQWEEFTQSYDCIALSCRFNWPNGNTMEAPDHSALQNADDVVVFMDLLGIDKAVIVGSSYGAFAALGLVTRYPERVLAVVGVEPPMMKYAQMYEDTAPVAQAFLEASAWPARDAFARGEDDLGAMLLTGGINNCDVATIAEEKLRRRRENVMAGKRVTLSSDEFPLIAPEDLARVTIPTMILTGADTAPVFKAMMAGINRSMPQAPLIVVKEASHSVSQDQPEVFNTLTLNFLAQHL